MTSATSNLSDLQNENHRLREAIAAAKQQLDQAAAGLNEIITDEFFLAETPLEVSSAMEIAAENIGAAICSLTLATTTRGTSVPGGLTRQQGQFLAYIREYMLRNHQHVAPTHADFQRFFNLTPPSVNSMLKRLDEKGYIRRIPGKSRAIELTIATERIPALERPFRQ